MNWPFYVACVRPDWLIHLIHRRMAFMRDRSTTRCFLEQAINLQSVPEKITIDKNRFGVLEASMLR
jgi:transposase-like protein